MARRAAWALFGDLDGEFSESVAAFSRDLEDRQAPLVAQASLRNGRALDTPERLEELMSLCWRCAGTG